MTEKEVIAYFFRVRKLVNIKGIEEAAGLKAFRLNNIMKGVNHHLTPNEVMSLIPIIMELSSGNVTTQDELLEFIAHLQNRKFITKRGIGKAANLKDNRLNNVMLSSFSAFSKEEFERLVNIMKSFKINN
ncbi:hypothetical protein [Runella limosa]|uniref:hypothetical protein n=1 Tax=Runella limosa TaxID=370978 RepID=UPI000416372F|nr:hypothetical protein [Runella limosa]